MLGLARKAFCASLRSAASTGVVSTENVGYMKYWCANIRISGSADQPGTIGLPAWAEKASKESPPTAIKPDLRISISLF